MDIGKIESRSNSASKGKVYHNTVKTFVDEFSDQQFGAQR